ncbi:hypothetical protein QR680_010755 [Steinernema hermaphroditum]|uniref:DNA2/NAM7 helicase-like C-terminal domain-containing protein n=1 Tax=Steinernema hermaphroditum TaxID=289476 RepID=A0AA39IRT6_9BILA|nr:hypothetical protein QR680_010755 [Steinernema hermaphroditum]
MVTCLPELEKVLLTGDAYQLPAYAYHLKGQVLDGGLESVITAVQRRKTVPTSALSISYRPHPALVEVQKALYNDRLKSGLTQEQRNLLASVGFPLPNAAIPLVLINTPHEHQRAACGSRYNLEQEELVLDLLAHLRSQFPVASIVESNVLIRTVDSYQGREADIVVVVTTRTALLQRTNATIEFAGTSDDDFLLLDERAGTSTSLLQDAPGAPSSPMP